MGRRRQPSTAGPHRHLKRFVCIIASIDLALWVYLGFAHLDTQNNVAQPENHVAQAISQPTTPATPPPVVIVPTPITPATPSAPLTITAAPTPSAKLIHVPGPADLAAVTTAAPTTTHKAPVTSTPTKTTKPATPSATRTTSPPTPAARATATTPSDTLDCPDFSSQAAAQATLRADRSDPNHLDANHDGVACEDYHYGTPTTAPATTSAAPTSTATSSSASTPNGTQTTTKSAAAEGG